MGFKIFQRISLSLLTLSVVFFLVQGQVRADDQGQLPTGVATDSVSPAAPALPELQVPALPKDQTPELVIEVPQSPADAA